MKNRFLTGWIAIGCLVVSALIGGTSVYAQNNSALVGSARTTTSPDCYRLTQAGNGQTGAVWFSKLLQLTESFELKFTINFGANPLGADGVVMVMQTQGNQALGGPSGGIGFKGLRPSFGIEFDTHRNLESGDPVEDHISFVRDGISDHRLNTVFAPPVSITATRTTVKDGRDHYVNVNWNAVTRILQVEVDCVPRISQSMDLVNDIFGGVQEVFWGFTSATGVGGSEHTVCLQKEVVHPDTLRMCQNEVTTLIAPVSVTNQYEWTPAIGLDDPHSQKPQLTARSSQLYTVHYVDQCMQPKTDRIYVSVRNPGLSLGDNRQACENEVVELTPTLTPTTIPVSYQWSTGETTPQLQPKTSGHYSLTITAEGCSVSDSVMVTFNPRPKSGLQTQPTYDCPGNQPVLLDPAVTGAGLQFTWTPGGSKEPTLMADVPGRYSVKITTEFGCSVDQGFTILDNCLSSALLFVPDVFTPNDDGINEFFEWKSNVDIEARMSIFNRWGKVVFASENPQEFWNGTWQGEPCPPTVYAWRLEYRPRQSKERHWFVKRGEVLLMR